jgi:hypothetical protein
MTTSSARPNPTDFVGSHAQEAIKVHYEYDGLGRLEYIYTANHYSLDGAPCMGTKYQYVGATTVIDGWKEFQAVWLAAWDIP